MTVAVASELRPVRKLVETITGTRPSPSTLHRWLHKGLCGGIKLKAVRLGGEWLTTREDLDAFIAAQTAAALATPGNAPIESGRTERLERELVAAGLV